MRRYWIWMIPILAAASAIWIQAALHGYDAGDYMAPPTARLELRDIFAENNTAHVTPDSLDHPSHRNGQPIP